MLDPLKLGGVPVRVPLVAERIDLDALLAAITPRTKLVFIAAPNNPTGTTNDRAELDAYFERVPSHVLTVLDQAYFEYLDEPDYPDGIAEYFAAGRRVLVLRTFSKIFGLAGLRVGYGIGPEEVIAAVGKVRRAFDVTSVGQEAALASLSAPDELERRRAVEPARDESAPGRAARARARAGWACRCELPLRPRRRRRCGERRFAPPRGHRASDGSVRCA